MACVEPRAAAARAAPDLPFGRNKCTKTYDLCLVRARAAYCFGPMSIVQDPGCWNDGRTWSRFIGTVVEVLSRRVVLVRPCNKGSKLSRSHGIMVEVFLFILLCPARYEGAVARYRRLITHYGEPAAAIKSARVVITPPPLHPGVFLVRGRRRPYCATPA